MDTRSTHTVPVDPVIPGALSAASIDDPFRVLDRIKEAAVARVTGGVSPAALTLAFSDWLIHLTSASGKQLELLALAMRNARWTAEYLSNLATRTVPSELAIPLSGDRRFQAEVWQTEPFRFSQQVFLLAEQWWSAATHDVPGMTHHHQHVVSFSARQLLDVVAPTNSPWTNPEVLQRTAATYGANLWQGAFNLVDDAERQAKGDSPLGVDQFVVGVEVAVTPGKVVFANHLIELIQYTPTTELVTAEPILIIPAWIMKYYILDLSPHNSMVRYLVGQGHTVFCVSWRNVSAEDRDLSLDDYRRLGVMAALDAVSEIAPDRKIHATGYCLGGTLLSIAAAAMANTGDQRLATVTLLAAQADFTEPGELQLFVDDSEIYFLESMMWSQGFLAGNQMSASFQLLHSNDLIWSRVIHDYLLGQRVPMFDLMAWDADTTRMPYRMHAEYLRELFLDNDLASGRYGVEGRRVSLHNIRAPIFTVCMERDHIAPWQSVYKIHYLCDTDITCVLTSGGHNAGIVSEPGHANRQFSIKFTPANDLRVGPEDWKAAATPEQGSWWPAWSAWINNHSDPVPVAPPQMGFKSADMTTLTSAPGTYVFQH